MSRAGIVVSLALAASLLGPATAQAVSCAPDPDYDPLRDNPVVFDGIVLSGERVGWDLAVSPARVLVVRRIKGRLPRVTRVLTGTSGGVFFFGVVSGGFAPSIGESVRVYGQRLRGRAARRRGVPAGTVTAEPCGGSSTRSSLVRRVPSGSRRASARPGERPWVSRLMRGPAGAWCLRLFPDRSGPRSHRTDCERMRPAGRALLARLAAPGLGTGVAAFAPDLRTLRVEAPDGSVTEAQGPAATAALPGEWEPYELPVRLEFTDGRVSISRADADVRAVVREPGRPGHWWALTRREGGRTCVYADRLARDEPRTWGVRTCGELRGPHSYFLAVRPLYVQDSEPREPPPSAATLVWGGVGSGIRRVRVSHGSQTADAVISRRGRGWLAVLPADVAPSEVRVTIEMQDGSAVEIRGRRSAAGA